MDHQIPKLKEKIMLNKHGEINIEYLEQQVDIQYHHLKVFFGNTEDTIGRQMKSNSRGMAVRPQTGDSRSRSVS